MSTKSNSSARIRLLVIGLLLAVIGMAISLYSTLHHLEVKRSGKSNYACNISETVSCDDIARSPYSELMGAPLGIWGLAFFLAIAVILLLGHFLKENERDSLQGFALLTGIGALASVVLGVIAATLIGKYCIVCIGIYVTCFGLLALTATHWKAIPKPFDAKSLGNGGFSAALVMLIVVSGYNFFFPSKPKPLPTEFTETQLEEMQKLPKVEIPINKTPYSGFGEDFRKGSDAAKVVIVEFADFQCPACGVASKALTAVHSEFGDKVLLVYKNFPLDSACNPSVDRQIHQYACIVAKLARCAGEAGKFWEYYDLAFSNQPQMNNETAKKWAKEVGLSDAAIARCIESKDILAKIKDDVSIGNGLRINSTPTVFINGVQYRGDLEIDSFRAAIKRVLR